jgi:hypothetical protein
MIFYHFTGREYLPDIARDGLCKGEVPITQRAEDCLNAVWLTTDLNPDGHGLCDEHIPTVDEKRRMGVPADKIVKFPNKRAIRFKILIPTKDRNLMHWPAWGKKHLHRNWYDALSKEGGYKQKTWWLYWGVIPLRSLPDVTDLTTGNKLIGWPDEWANRPIAESVQAA